MPIDSIQLNQDTSKELFVMAIHSIDAMDKQDWFDVLTGPTEESRDAFQELRQKMSYSKLDLSGLDFTGKDFSGFNFSNCNLASCGFDFSYLTDASLVMCNLSRASFREVDLFQANLDEVELLLLILVIYIQTEMNLKKQLLTLKRP